jgi:hypothetical protein
LRISKVSSKVEFNLKSSVAFLKPGMAMAARMATMHRVTTTSMRVKPPLLKAPTLEHFDILVGSDARIGKASPGNFFEVL